MKYVDVAWAIASAVWWLAASMAMAVMVVAVMKG
jgi:hypothetical protein